MVIQTSSEATEYEADAEDDVHELMERPTTFLSQN